MIFLSIFSAVLAYGQPALGGETGRTVDPMAEAFSRYGIPFNASNELKKFESLRERVCRAHSALKNPKAIIKVGADWVASDFSGRTPSEIRELQARLMAAVLRSGALELEYARLVAEEKRLAGLSCNKFREWVASRFMGKDSAGALPGSCKIADRRLWVAGLVRLPAFVSSRAKIYGSEDLEGPLLDRMYANAVSLGDAVAALAINLSGGKEFSVIRPAKESFGVPPGPYACSGSAKIKNREGTSPIEPIISTSYYYWYDFEFDGVSKNEARWKDVFSIMPAVSSGMHYNNVEWHSRELREMRSAGINTVLPVYRGGPLGRFEYSDTGLISLVRSLGRTNGDSTVKLGLLIDGFVLIPKGNARGEHIDLSTLRGGRYLAAVARDFFSLIPDTHRASVEERWLVGIKDLRLARSVSTIGLDEFRKQFTKVFGDRSYFIFPRHEMVNYVDAAATPSVQSATQRLTSGIPVTEVATGMLSSEALSRRIGPTTFELAQHLHMHDCALWFHTGDFTSPNKKDWWIPHWLEMSRQALYREAFELCYNNLIERIRSRVLGTRPVFLKDYHRDASLLSKDLLVHMADFYASPRFYDETKGSRSGLIALLSLAVIGRCPNSEETIKLESMLKTWDRRRAMPYYLAGHPALRRLAASWHVDHLMSSPTISSQEIAWEGFPCGFSPGIPTITPGRDDHLIARIGNRKPGVVDRNFSSLYTSLWELVLKRRQFPSIIHIESWNGYHDGTAIAASLEHGTRYRDLTRDFTRKYAKAYANRPIENNVDRVISSEPAK